VAKNVRIVYSRSLHRFCPLQNLCVPCIAQVWQVGDFIAATIGGLCWTALIDSRSAPRREAREEEA
jgi:hypothetical protein